jgi:hypothetical protein
MDGAIDRAGEFSSCDSRDDQGQGMEITQSMGQLIVSDKAWKAWPAMIFVSLVFVLTAFVLVHARDIGPYASETGIRYVALLMVGIACWLLSLPTRTAVFDTREQELQLENRWWVGLRRSRKIPFREIAAIGIDTKSWSNQYWPSYRLRIRLASGHTVALTNWSGRTGGMPSGTSWSKQGDNSLYDPVFDEYRTVANRIREVVGIG